MLRYYKVTWLEQISVQLRSVKCRLARNLAFLATVRRSGSILPLESVKVEEEAATVSGAIRRYTPQMEPENYSLK